MQFCEWCDIYCGVLYVVYKAEKLWGTWTMGGPRGEPFCTCLGCSAGTWYNRSHHGWCDSGIFQDWYLSCFLPHEKRLGRPTVLLGDNLSSHFTYDVLKSCEENNMRFVCLLPEY